MAFRKGTPRLLLESAKQLRIQLACTSGGSYSVAGNRKKEIRRVRRSLSLESNDMKDKVDH